MYADYKKGIGGEGVVDKSDQITDQYLSELKTVKCWKKIVFHLISRTTSNAYICYVQNNNKYYWPDTSGVPGCTRRGVWLQDLLKHVGRQVARVYVQSQHV